MLEEAGEQPAKLPAAVQPEQGPAPDAAGPGAPDDESANPLRYLSALSRRKWLILLLTLVGAAGGFVASRLVPLQYRAMATLWVEVGEDTRGGRQTGPIQPAELLQSSSWIDLLNSFVVLDEVVRRQRLYLELPAAGDSLAFTEFHLKEHFGLGNFELDVSPDGRSFDLLAEDHAIQHGAVGDSIGNKVGFDWVPAPGRLQPGRHIKFRVRAPRDAALAMRDKLSSIFPREGSFLRLELTGPNPGKTAATLNSLADRFVDVAAELKRQKLKELADILEQQLNSSYTALGSAERSLETFRVHTITLPSEQASPVAAGLEQTRDPVFRSFFDMRVERDQLDRDRQAIERAMAQPDSEVSAMELEAIPAVRASSELTQALSQLSSKEAEARAMRLQFGANYPPLQRLQQEIGDLQHQSIPDLARKLVADLQSRVRDADARIGSASRELEQIPSRAITEARLRRDVTIAENLYTTLQQRFQEAKLAEVSSVPDVRILDRAVTPEKPEKDRAIAIMIGGVFAGFAVAVALALLLDRFDRRFHYLDQVTEGMGLTILGALPRLRGRNTRLGSETESQIVEALRTIRLNLKHSYGAAGPVIFVITSPGGGEGKSFLASNLSASFAEAGNRTLLVDADIRRGALHQLFELPRKPGLLDHLGGNASLEQIVRPTSLENVDFIPSGTRRNAGPELLTSPLMGQLLMWARANYKAIIVDCAPLGAGVDPLIVGTLTGAMVVVLRSGVSDRELARAKLETMSRLPIRLLGAVLNDVRPGMGTEYYYSYSYLPGYETTEEEEGVAVVKRLPDGR